MPPHHALCPQAAAATAAAGIAVFNVLDVPINFFFPGG